MLLQLVQISNNSKTNIYHICREHIDILCVSGIRKHLAVTTNKNLYGVILCTKEI